MLNEYSSIIGISAGGIGMASIIFTAGLHWGSSKKYYVKQENCNKNINKMDTQMITLHEKINKVAESTARIEGYLNRNRRLNELD